MKQTILGISFFLISFSNLALSQDAKKRLDAFNTKNGLAILGYDPVSYFTEQKAVKGDAAISIYHAGITYRFSTIKNKELFKANPAQYEPQYGGWCAYAMGADGSKVEIDPETFKITNGKLYLFYHSYFNNTLLKWNKNETVLKEAADKHWIRLF